ncbi:MAG: phospholipid carrier-dependent glycosyltransferase [Bryobacteraceae bacterium]|jgi:4-amino-4-deoxy-L-arabinose transferase-like glycosyltransferase
MKDGKHRRKPAAKAEAGNGARSAFSFIERRSPILALALTMIATVRIVSTYRVFTHTFDEPAHIACGMEYLDKGVYKLEPQHPPLARLAAALGPYLAGIRSSGFLQHGPFEMNDEGLTVLYHEHRYERNLALARLGILPFFWVACLVIYRWGRRWFDPVVAVGALFLFSFLPPVLAHAGLATTDMALTAFLGAALLAGLNWVRQPGARTAAWFGVAGGLAVLSKFSALAFFPAAAAAALVWLLLRERPGLAWLWGAVRARLGTLCLAALVACVVVWAGYRFSFGRPDFGGIALPAPEFFNGIRQLMKHNSEGHMSYLLGQFSLTGFWYYYPVVLAVKTPLGFLVLLGAGVALACRKRDDTQGVWLPLAFAIGILLAAAFSRINIGVRHILPVYMAFSLAAAAAAVRLLREAPARKWVRYGLLAAAFWFAASSIVSHPDYLAYTNLLAGSEPEKVLADSDLDWGQDAKRLAVRLRELGAARVAFAPFAVADFVKEHGFPPAFDLNPYRPSPGWNAVSISAWKVARFGLFSEHPEAIFWPDRVKPVERVGKSILLYYFP